MSFVRRIGLLRPYASPLRIASGRAESKTSEVAGRDPRRLGKRLRWIAAFLPTILGIAYFGLIASAQYESEAKFIVRSTARPDGTGVLAGLLAFGLGKSQDDAFAVQEYMTSRDAISALRQQMPLESMYGVHDADFLARYPSFLYAQHDEEFHRYFDRMVTVIYSPSTGIMSLSVRAFRAKDALRIADGLLVLGEQLINRMNDRMQNDTVKVSIDQLELSRARLVESQVALTAFRNRELVIDPSRSAVALTEILGKLSADVAQNRAKIAEMTITSPGSPQLEIMRQRIVAFEQQIAAERSRIGNGPDNLAERIATYERLKLEHDFAEKTVESAEKDLVRARREAQLQHLYLERIVEPQLSDHAMFPKRLQNVLTILAGNLLLALVGWLIFTGVREHASQAH